jgi:hypothetical protein
MQHNNDHTRHKSDGFWRKNNLQEQRLRYVILALNRLRYLTTLDYNGMCQKLRSRKQANCVVNNYSANYHGLQIGCDRNLDVQIKPLVFNGSEEQLREHYSREHKNQC